MKKDEFKKRMADAGDAVVTYRSQNSRKLKYNVCTIDFSTDYIQQKRNRAKEGQHTVLLFYAALLYASEVAHGGGATELPPPCTV